MRGHGLPCEYCKREMRADVEPAHPLRATKDHYMPKSKRKGGDESIIVMACYTCNHIKGDRFPEQWDRFMQRNPRWWEPQGQARKRSPERAAPLPIEHSKYILQHGKKAYREWVGTKKASLAALHAMTGVENARRMSEYQAWIYAKYAAAEFGETPQSGVDGQGKSP